MAPDEEFNVTMKLLIDTQNNRVLFAEASKECVDFLLHMLSLPIAMVISLENGMVGGVENLYYSIQNLDESYIMKNHSRNSLLKPNFKPCACTVPMLKLNNDGVACVVPVSDVAGNGGGLVKGVVTYMVTDALVVQPMSNISFIGLLSKFNVGDVSLLQEKIVTMGFKEAVKLLKASLHSVNVLTQVFLAKSEPKVEKIAEITELKSQISQLENDLKTMKVQVCSPQAQKQVLESNQQLEDSKMKHDAVAAELEQSKARVNLLEEHVSELRAEIINCREETKKSAEVPKVKKNNSMNSEVKRLKSALEAAEIRCKEQARIIEQMNNFDMLDKIKSRASRRKAKVEKKLRESTDLVTQLRAQLIDEETKSLGISEQNKELASKLGQLQEKENLLISDLTNKDIELQILKENLAQNKWLVEEMTNMLNSCKESEAQAKIIASETLVQLETATKTVEKFKTCVNALEEYVTKLRAKIEDSRKETKKSEEASETEIMSMKLQVEQLKSALEATAIRCKEHAGSIKQVEKIKAELEKELCGHSSLIRKLKANLMDKETKIQSICKQNEELASKLDQLQRENLENKEPDEFCLV